MTATIGGKGTSSKTFLWITIEDREYEFTFNTHEEACFAKEKWLQQFAAAQTGIGDGVILMNRSAEASG